MKRIAWVTALLLSLVLCLSVPALAAEDVEAGESAAPVGTEEGLPAPQADMPSSGTCGDGLTWTLDNGGILTISGTGPMSDYSGESSSPWDYNYYKENIARVVISDGVSCIGNHSFYDCSNLTEVSIPSSLERIGDNAFCRCTSLERVVITYAYGSELRSIGDSAFFNCKKLVEIDLNEIRKLETIGDSAFSLCGSLREITIPYSVNSIGASAFYHCDSLETANISDGYGTTGLKSIGDHAFSMCSSLTDANVLPYGIRSVGAYAFSFCEKLKFPLWFSPSLTYIGEGAFLRCSSFTSAGSGTLYFPENLTLIGKYTFQGCTGLTGAISLPSGLTSIGESAFQDCTGLTGTLDLPSGLTSIGNSAFQGCSGFTNLRLPDTLTSIGESAFRGCTSITGDAYDVITIPGGVKNIADGTFYGCSSLKWLKIAEGVESIGKSAFYNCKSLIGVPFIIPDGVTSIENSAFYQAGCSYYKVPGSLMRIGGDVFNTGTQWLEYGGTESQWRGVQGYNNSPLDRFMSGGRIHYSETPYPIPVQSVSLNYSTASIIETSRFSSMIATVYPSNAMDQTVTWSSDNPSVATVDSSGRIKGVRVGTAVITASAGGKTATCTVTVTPVPDYGYIGETLNLDAGAVDLIPGMSTAVMRARLSYAVPSLSDPQIWWRVLDPGVALLSNRASVAGEKAGELYTPVTGIQDCAVNIHPQSYGSTVVIATLVQAFTNGNYTGVGNPVAFTITMHRPGEMVAVQPSKLSIGVGQTKTIRVETAVKGLNSASSGWWYGTQETSDGMVEILDTVKEEDSNTFLVTVRGVRTGQTSLGPCMMYNGAVVSATTKDCAITVTAQPTQTYSMGPGGEVTVEKEGRQINVLTGPVSGKQPLWAASYDPRGKLISLQKLTSPAASATVPAGAGRCKLMWLDEKSAPKCGNLEFTF